MNENQIERVLSSLKEDDSITIEFENREAEEFSVISIDHIDGKHYRISLAGDENIQILKYNRNKKRYIVTKKNSKTEKIIQSIKFPYK